MSRRGRAMPSVLPVPARSQGSPGRSLASSQGLSGQATLAHSAEDIPKQLSSSPEKDKKTPPRRRVPSPGETRRGSLVAQVKSGMQAGATHPPGVRYITEDLIKKIAKEDNLDLITSLSLTLAGEKKIKYIENLDKLKKLQSLNLSSNAIERIEHLDKLVLLRELNLANNMISRIEGLETLTSLQSLNISDNHVEHIPPWFAKKLKSLRTFRIARNRLASLSEVSRLKALPDLTQLDIAGNPMCEIPHCTPYVVFHLRTLQILDGRTILDEERKEAKDRLAIDEVRQLERKLEQEETKFKQLEETYNKSMQERSFQESSHTEMTSKKNILQNRLKQMEQELSAKDEQLKKKTLLLNTASQKHYQLEQELAFYKIDKKFNMLSEVPQLQVDSADDSSADIQEVPYIGKARFVANQHAQESILSGANAQVIQTHAVKSSATSLQLAAPSLVNEKMHAVLDLDLEGKKAEVKKTEERLKSLQADLSATERRLLNAATELKKLAIDRNTPEPFRDDNKYKLRQRLARKMQKVNELRESAAQIQTEIDRQQEHISVARSEIHKIKNELTQIDVSSSSYETKQKELVNKESQLVKFSQAHSQLKKEHDDTLANIGRETTDIQKLEDQLTTNNADQSVEIHHDLDDIVTGLSDYLENVKGQNQQHRQDFEIMVQEKEGLEEKILQMEAELPILEREASNARQMQKKLTELEDSLRKTEELNASLKDEVHQTQQKDPDLQNRLLKAENEAKQLRQTLTETERKTEMEWKAMQKQLQTERERAEKMAHRIQDVNRQDLETKKLMSQLEAAKALNVGLRDQIEEFKHKQQMVEGGFKPSDLKKRLKKFVHDFKSNKNPIEPQDRSDILGLTFHELQKHTQQQLNLSAKEVVELKKTKEKADAEIQTLKEKLKKVDTGSQKDQAEDIRLLQDENKQLQEDIKRLKKMLEEARERNKEGAIPVRIVYRPDSDSGDRASSLNSDEKHLFDELQKELLDLKQSMRYHENDLSRKVTDAESEAAHWKDEIRQKEKEFEAELEMHRLAAELMREKQEARIQVIAQDLDQAQFIAESLQRMLEDRERALREVLSNADMSNQMITAQEEELTKLYEILEAQRNEIEHLNQILDHLAQQGPDGVGVAFDDELWHIRQEVNNLKETLAMQSAYVQAMPGVGQMGSQADGSPFGEFGPPDFPAHRMAELSVRNSGAGAAAEVHVGGDRLFASLPASPMMAAGIQKRFGQTHAGWHPDSIPSGQAAGPTTPVNHNYNPSQTFSIPADTREQPEEHLGTERRESKSPSPGKSAVGKSGGGRINQGEDRTQERVQSQSIQHVRRGSAPSTRLPSAFEPAVEPAVYHPRQTLPPQADTVHVPTTAVYVGASPGNRTTGSNMSPHIGANFPLHIGPNLPHAAPTHSSQGMQGLSRGVQAGSGQQELPQSVGYPGVPAEYIRPTSLGSTHRGPPFAGHQPASSVPVDTSRVYGVSVAPGPAMIPGAAAGPVNPPVVEAGYNRDMFYQGFDGPSDRRGYMIDRQTYLPSGPTQMSHYGPERFYIPARTAYSGRLPARVYYPQHQPVPMPAPGGAPPPPPPGGHTQVFAHVPRSASMTPVATATPVKRGMFRIPAENGYYFTVPPSPIRVGGIDVDDPRGIPRNMDVEHTEADGSYLYCNVPEHHDLEDYIAELQEYIKKLKLRLSKENNFQEDSVFVEERKNIKKLLNDLEDRRTELQGLDLAIERQKRNLHEMQLDEKELRKDREEALDELGFWRRRNNKKIFTSIRRHRSKDDRFDEEAERSRQKYIKDEVACLEKTLAKRQAQLRDTERSLKECKSNLLDAKEQARETVKRYDDATGSLHQALREQQEIEKRSNDICVELVTASEKLATLKAEVRDIERKKSRQEKLLREINNIIAKKDGEFKDLDLKVKSVSQSLQRLNSDLAVHTQREKGMVEAMRDSEDLLAKRRSEIQRIQDQIDQSRQDLEKLDQQIGRRKTELQLLQETQERKQQELANVLQDAKSEIASRRREIQDCRDEIAQLDHHKADLSAHIKTKKTELQKLKEEREQEEQVLQHLTDSINKSKSELKHTLEMQNIELTELENIKDQHAQKMAELERTQRALQEEKSNLEQLALESARKNAELERLRQALERDRLEVEQLKKEKQNLDDQMANLTRDRNLLDENCKTMDDKLNNMKRNQRIMEEKIDFTKGRLEMLEAELRVKERETEEAEIRREDMQKEITTLMQSIKESKTELKTVQESLREAENRMREMDQDARAVFHQRDEAKQELWRLNEQIQRSLAAIQEHSQEEKLKHRELQDLLRALAATDKEQLEAKKALNKLKVEVEHEESRLRKLINNANLDLERVRTELDKKQEELKEMKIEYSELQKKCDELQNNEDSVAELRRVRKDLEQAVQDREEEKAQFAKALSASHEEVQRLCQKSLQLKDLLVQKPAKLDNSVTDDHAAVSEQSQQEVKITENTTNSKQSGLESSADKNSKPNNGAEVELSLARKEDYVAKKQSDRSSVDKENRALTNARIVPVHRRTTIHSAHTVKEYNWRKDALRERLAQERDYLRFHLQQQLLRQSETMKSARKKSEETIDCLRWKLNNFQEGLYHASPDFQAIRVLAKARSRSGSPSYNIGLRQGRTRSPSPPNWSDHNDLLAHRRSRSYESLGALDSPDYL